MTEEIIIDGVNVAGCEYYKGKCMEYTHYCQIGCKECTDIGIKLCHYKQTERFKAKIDRLEQENKILKSNTNVLNDYITKNEQLKTNIDSLVKINERLKQENKELKEKIIKLSEEKGHLIVENNTLKEENEGLKIKHQRYRECSMQLNKKYKSALEETREIAKDIIKNDVYENSDVKAEKILNKINEVLK